MEKNINILINQQKIEFDIFFQKLLYSILSKDELSKAMIYSCISGGKRIRPFLVKTFANIANIRKANYQRLSASIECIHTYSLIHDDLPSMDNDDFRRGKPSLHKRFNEAIAILAGDALHDLAFEILSDKKTHEKHETRIEIIKKLSNVIGAKGLAGGQSLDLLFEKKNTEKKHVINMYRMKTSSLFDFCCSAPMILAKKSKQEISFAAQYGNLFGLIFQIIDDINDQNENFKTLGKTPKKDSKLGKKTLVSILGEKEVISYCYNEITSFTKNNKFFFKRWEILEKILFFQINKYL